MQRHRHYGQSLCRRDASRNDTADLPCRRQPNNGATDPEARPFWESKTLEAMTPDEWESLCDRCGRCCLVKLEDEDTGEILHTDIACKLFDAGACSCVGLCRVGSAKVSDCIKLTPASVPSRSDGCRRPAPIVLVKEGKPLEGWHPLVSGSPESVHEAGISVRGRIGGSETTVKLRDYVDHIVDWGA